MVIGGINLRWRTDLPWIAEPKPAQTSCTAPPLEVPESQRITVEAAKDLLGRADVTWIDARAPLNFVRAHLPGAFSLPVETAVNMLPVQSLPIAPDNLIVTYCDGGPCELSEALAQLLVEQAGCSRVRVLDGGFSAWVEAGLPIERADEQKRSDTSESGNSQVPKTETQTP
jgi:rhodanese-related sulfurtransferase